MAEWQSSIGPTASRVMTSGEFVHLLVEKVTYWHVCLIIKISGLCQGFLLSKFIGYYNSIYTFHNRGFQRKYEIYIGIYIYISGHNEVSRNFIIYNDISRIESIQIFSCSLIYVMNF